MIGGFRNPRSAREAAHQVDQRAGRKAQRGSSINLLMSPGGGAVPGDVAAGLAVSDFVAEGAFETGFVEHAYIEPEAGFARRVGDRIEIQACTQAPPGSSPCSRRFPSWPRSRRSTAR